MAKTADEIAPAPSRNSTSSAERYGKIENAENATEVFKTGEGGVEFRTVGWIHASVIFLKSQLTLSPFH